MARRALLLIDGVDEGGVQRAQIEDHIVNVLAPQGHTMLVTSRLGGVCLEKFRPLFHRVTLCALTHKQQQQVIR